MGFSYVLACFSYVLAMFLAVFSYGLAIFSFFKLFLAGHTKVFSWFCLGGPKASPAPYDGEAALSVRPKPRAKQRQKPRLRLDVDSGLLDVFLFSWIFSRVFLETFQDFLGFSSDFLGFCRVL